MPTVEAGSVVVRIEGKDVSLSAMLQNVQQVMAQTVNASNTLIGTIGGLDAKLAKEEAEILAAASAFLRYQESIGQTAVGQERLIEALQNSTQDTIAYINALNLLQASQTRAEAADRKALQAKEAETASANKLAASLLAEERAVDAASRKALQAREAETAAANKLAAAIYAEEQAIEAKRAALLAEIQAEIELASKQQLAAELAHREAQGINETTEALEREAAAKLSSKSAGDQLVGGLSKLIGVYFAVTQIASKVTDAISKGNELEKTEATFKALSKTQEEYANNLAAVKRQQEQFGGSLKDTEEDLSGFIFSARSAKVPVDELLNLGRKLALLDPAQGIRGASIAIREFLAGTPRSMADRFEIPKTTLNSINKLGSNVEKLAALNTLLASMGVTQDTLAASTKTSAIEFDKLKGAADDALAGIGQIIASDALPAVQTLTGALKQILPAFQALLGAKGKEEALATVFAKGSNSAAEFNTKINSVNAQTQGMFRLFTVLGLANPLLGVTSAIGQSFVPAMKQADESTFKFFQDSLAAGDSLAVATEKAQAFKAALDANALAFNGLNGNFEATSAEALKYGEATQQAAATGVVGSQVAEALAVSIQNHSLSVEEATAQLQNYIASTVAAATASENQAAKTDLATAALKAEKAAMDAKILADIQGQTESQKLEIRQQQLEQAARNAGTGLLATANAAHFMAQSFGVSFTEALKLIGALRELDAVKAGKGNAQTTGFAGQNYKSTILPLVAAQDDLRKSTRTTAESLAYEEDRLSRLSKTNVEYYKTQERINSLKDKLEKEGKKKGAGSKLSDQEKLNNQLLASDEKFEDKLYDEEVKHQKALEDIEKEHAANKLKINADYQKKLQEQTNQNEVGKRRNRVDFYEGLNSPGVDAAKYAAEYEDAFAKSQEIAQKGSKKLAAEYLKLREDQINELKDLDKEEADVNADDKTSDKQKQAALEYLEGRRKLIQDAQAEELAQLEAGGDAINNEYNQKLADEQAAYSEHLSTEETRFQEAKDKIGLADDRATERLVNNALRNKKAIDETNLSLKEQVNLYEKKAKAVGVTNPATAADTQGAQATIPVPNTINNAPTLESLAVTQLDVWIVKDQGVIDSIGRLQLSLENKLAGMITAIDDATTVISSAVNRVESAIGRLRSAGNNAVTAN